MNSFATQEESLARSTTCAKKNLQARFALEKDLTGHEQLVLQRICDAIFDGDLKRLADAVAELSVVPARSAHLAAVLADALSCPGICILPLQNARWRFQGAHESEHISIFAIQLVNARRILALATDKRFGAHVFGPEGPDGQGISNELNEDPRILLKQIGGLAAFSTSAPPPPLYTGRQLP
jgi:hypothetical protein